MQPNLLQLPIQQVAVGNVTGDNMRGFSYYQLNSYTEVSSLCQPGLTEHSLIMNRDQLFLDIKMIQCKKWYK